MRLIPRRTGALICLASAERRLLRPPVSVGASSVTRPGDSRGAESWPVGRCGAAVSPPVIDGPLFLSLADRTLHLNAACETPGAGVMA